MHSYCYILFSRRSTMTSCVYRIFREDFNVFARCHVRINTIRYTLLFVFIEYALYTVNFTLYIYYEYKMCTK